MKFINPYEVLELNTLDNSEVKKAKRRKLADFELSNDATIKYKNGTIHKADFIRVVDELDDEKKSNYYWFLKNNTELNDFLSTGDTWFFANYQPQRIFNNSEFIDFISPFFTHRYNELLLKTFQKQDASLLKKITSVSPLISSLDIDKAYQGVRRELDTQLKTLHRIRTDIDNEEGHYDEDNSNEIPADLQHKINVNLYNALPSYFQSQRDDIAQKLRNISVAAFNSLHDPYAALKTINLALELDINSLKKQSFQEDYDQINDIFRQREEADKYEPILLKYIEGINSLTSLVDKVKSTDITNSLVERVNYIFNIQELNNQPDLFDEIRRQIALLIRSLSVEVFNNHGNIKVALLLIKLAQQINTDFETTQNITEAESHLRKLEREREIRQMKEFGQITETIININRNVNANGASSINQIALQDLLNKIFTKENTSRLASFENKVLKKLMVDALLELCTWTLDLDYARKFVVKISEIAGNDTSLENSVIKWRSDLFQAEADIIRSNKELERLQAESSCYIATACYGDYDAPEVLVFRQFRDNVLLKKELGKSFVSFYYRFSPYWAEKLKTRQKINGLVKKLVLNPIYNILKK